MSGHLIARYVHAIWLGSGLFLIAVAAPAAFRGAPNSTIAADVVGMLQDLADKGFLTEARERTP